MSLKDIILPFDKRVVTEEEILEHIQHYYDLADKGMSLLDNNRQRALECLKEIRKTMSQEYKHHNSSKIKRIMTNNKMYNEYYHCISESFSNQINPRSYESLPSNLYDVRYYTSYYYSNKLKK